MKIKLNWILVAIFIIVYFLSVSKQLFSMNYDVPPALKRVKSSAPADNSYYADDERSSDSETEEQVSSSGTEDYSYIDALDDGLLKTMTIDDWVTRPTLSKDLLYLTNKFILKTLSVYKNSPWLYNKSIDEQIKNILEWKLTGKRELKVSKLPCIAKLIVPQNTRVEIIGDIHGEMDTMEAIFHSLKNKNLINELMYIPDNARIIFLGDYTDRGDFNLQVLESALILSAKNPDKVFLLKGNHEFDITKQNSEVLAEIKEMERKDIRARNILLSNIIKVYEFMPVGMFVGLQGQSQTPFYFLAHGGPDIRYDYSDFLNLHNENLCFWMLTIEDILKTTKTQELFENIYKQIAQNPEIINALKLYTIESLAFGFLWNDIIDFSCAFPIFKGHRGPSCIALGAKFIQYFLESFTNENVKIVGLIRGHQHRLAKKIDRLPSYTTLSPSCSYFTSNSKQWNLLLPGAPEILNNTFSIVTVISGQIQEGGKIIQYPPTFLELRFLENGTHTIEAIEHAYN